MPRSRDIAFTVRVEFSPDPIIDRDGRQIAVAIIADDLVRVSTAVCPFRWKLALSEALTRLQNRPVRSHEALPEKQNQRYAKGFDDAMRQIMGDEGRAE